MTILILGGTGRTGARIHHRLSIKGVPTRLASRRTGFDWDQPETWSDAIHGTTAAYVCFTPDLDDVADAAVQALTCTVPEDATYELSGPELLTFAQTAAILTDACKRQVTFISVDVPTFVADLAQDGVPAHEAEPLAHLFTEILDGRNASLSAGVETLLGRPASSFSAYARAAAASGVWS